MATQEDIRKLLLANRELRDRVEALEGTVAALVAHVGYVTPEPPAVPPLPDEVERLLERGDRRGAILALARARGVSKHLAERELDSRPPAA